MREQRRQILRAAVCEQERSAVGGQDLRDVVDKALGHRPCTIPDVHGEQSFALRIDGRPHPMRGTRQACARLGLRDFSSLHSPKKGQEFVELHLRDAYVVEDIP